METLSSLFPEGTDMNEVKNPENGAKPEIWLEWDKFTAAAKGLGEKSTALKAAALENGERDVIGQAFGDMGKDGCGSCHKPFRVKLKK